MPKYINKDKVIEELKKRIEKYKILHSNSQLNLSKIALKENIVEYYNFLSFLDTLEVKEVNIADMADEYYDALMEEAAVWMDEGTMKHCRLAYYNGCKDVLNKIQKGE